MVEAQMRRRKPSSLQFVGDVARAEHAGGEADEGIQTTKTISGRRPECRASRGFPNEQRQSGEKREESAAMFRLADRRYPANASTAAAITGMISRKVTPLTVWRSSLPSRYWSPRSRSRASRSTVSNRSRIRTGNPDHDKSDKDRKATLISTTSGMPLAPVARG